MLTYSDNAAFWVFNRLAHFKYLFYNRVIEDIRKVQSELENSYEEKVAEMDKKALGMDAEQLTPALTAFAAECSSNTIARWKQLDNYLLVKYLDSNIKQEENGEFLRNGYGYPAKPIQQGYPESWKKRIVEESGETFKVR